MTSRLRTNAPKVAPADKTLGEDLQHIYDFNHIKVSKGQLTGSHYFV